MVNIEHKGNKFRNFSTYVICGISLVIMTFLVVVSFISTNDVRAEGPYLEQIVRTNDIVLLNIFTAFCGFTIAGFLVKVTDKLKFRTIMLIMSLWILITGLLWVFSVFFYPTNDSFYTTYIGNSFANNKYDFGCNTSEATEDFYQYIDYYPFQLGFVFYCEILIRLFPLPAYITLQVFNVLFLIMAMCFIVKTVQLVAGDKAASITAVLCTVSIQPILFCSFLYSIIPALAFAGSAVFLMYKFMEITNGISAFSPFFQSQFQYA